MSATTIRRVLPFFMAALLAGCAAESGPSEPLEAGDEGGEFIALEGDDAGDEDVGEADAALSGSYAPTAEDTDAKRINDRRAAIGRKALLRRSCLNGIARAWSQKLAGANKLSHNPYLKNQVDGQCGSLVWKRLGENVGRGASEYAIWKALMASSGHKANIENPYYDSMGIGIYKRSDGTFWLTQVFADF